MQSLMFAVPFPAAVFRPQCDHLRPLRKKLPSAQVMVMWWGLNASWMQSRGTFVCVAAPVVPANTPRAAAVSAAVTRALLRIVRSSAFPDHRDFDLTRVLELLLHVPCDLV